MALHETENSPKLDNLFSATQIMPVVPGKITLAMGVNAKRGALVTSAGALATAAADVYAVLAEDTDATGAATEAPVYLTGEFNANALSVGGSISVADCVVEARKIGIFIKENLTR
jgi:hypothetical protein